MVGMAPTSPVMNRSGVTGVTGTKSVTTTCVVGLMRDVMIDTTEIAVDQETVQRYFFLISRGLLFCFVEIV